MNTLVSVLVGFLFAFQSELALAESSLECSGVLQSILKKNKIDSLPALSSKVALSEIKEEWTRLESLRIFEIIPSSGTAKVESYIEFVEEFGKPVAVRLYVKSNRVVGVQFLSEKGIPSYKDITSYKLDENCEVENIVEGFEAPKMRGKNTLVNPKLCSQTKILMQSLPNLPKKDRNYDEACIAGGGKLINKKDLMNCYCQASDQKSREQINPFVSDCGSPLPEKRVEELIDANNGVLNIVTESSVKNLIDLCEKNRDLLESSPAGGIETTPAVLTQNTPAEVK